MQNEYYVGWITLALINSGLAKSMNRSSGNWFLFSLFLGPFGTLLLVITDSSKSGPNPSLRETLFSFSPKKIAKFFAGIFLFFAVLYLLSILFVR